MADVSPMPRDQRRATAGRGVEDSNADRNPIARVVEALRPEQGFLGLALVLLLTGTMAWSIADARWILGRDEITSFLVWLGIGAGLWSYVASRLGLAPWQAHVLGCVIGGLAIVEVVGSVMPNARPGLDGWFFAAANSVTQAYLDLTWRHQLTTLQYGHFCLVLGILVWGTAQAASYDVFGYGRSINGVLLLTAVFLANMCLTGHDQFRALVLFSAGALLLLLLAHAADERSGWIRHRIWKGRDFRAPNMDGGIAFAGLAICGSVALTAVASSAPLAGALSQVGSNLADAASRISGYLPSGGETRYQPPADFPVTSPISSSFQANQTQVFTVHVPNASVSFHWRLVAYDTFQSTGWSVGPGSQSPVEAGSTIDAGTLDLAGAGTPGRARVSYSVHVQDASLRHMVAANEPDSVNVGLSRSVVGEGSDLGVASLSTAATDYQVTAYVPEIDPAGAGLTEWRLRHAGNVFPGAFLARYTQGTALLGADARQLLAEIGTWYKAQGGDFAGEYDVAQAIQTYLLSDRFEYSTDISAEVAASCPGLSTADCFAVIRTGFCEHYATTMTMLVRLAGYPARYVQGYLPGQLDPNTLVQQVMSQQKHAWVEVWFPTYGWIPFDPTGGRIGRPTILPAGGPVPSTPPASTAPAAGGDDAAPSKAQPGGGASGGGSGSITSPVPVVIGGGIVSLAALLFAILWLRRPRRTVPPEAVYRDVVGLASRLGYGPRPAQTIYEYTGMLADVVPRARDPLEVVARAAVETSYGQRSLGADRLAALATARGLVRQALLRLAFRLPFVRLRGRRPGTRG